MHTLVCLRFAEVLLMMCQVAVFLSHAASDMPQVVQPLGGEHSSHECTGDVYFAGGDVAKGLQSEPTTSRTTRIEPTNKIAPDGTNLSCSSVILTTYITGLRDWQRNRHVTVDFSYMKAFYESVMSVNAHFGFGVRAHVLHDLLPDEFVQEYTAKDGSFRFQKVNISNHPADMGVNDVRFLLFREEVLAHPEWEVIFFTDIADVQLSRNPCQLVLPEADKFYINDQPGVLAPNRWMEKRFSSMGGQYLEWYKDPSLHDRKSGKEVNVDMAALNWAAHNLWNLSQVVFGFPLRNTAERSSKTAKYIYFLHKRYPTLR